MPLFSIYEPSLVTVRMTATLYIFALLLTMVMSSTDVTKRKEKFVRIPVLDNVLKLDHIVEVRSMGSKLVCGTQCTNLSEQCGSFAWNGRIRQCAIYKRTFDRVPASETNDTGWEHFNVKVCTPPEVRYGALSEDELFKPGTTISGSCDTGYASITGGITGSCDVNYQATIVGTCKQLITNAALLKPAAESSSAAPWLNAGDAVDGIRNPNWFENSCTHTGTGDMTPWWRVDLQAIYGIITVRMLNRGDPPQNVDVSDRLRDATITAGNATSAINKYCGFFAGPGTSGQLVTVNCVPWVVGRFVKIQLRTQYLTLCEVDVFAIIL